MTKSAKMLLKKMGEDKAFAEKILSQTEKEKVIEIAKGEGIDFTMEDIDEINEAVAKALQQKNDGELSEEELESVAGGILFETTLVSAAIISTSLIASVLVTPGVTISVVTTMMQENTGNSQGPHNA
ncbi:MAG: Nif11-like leader peptide family natural product precursor [Eubacteriales bacterium]|nr:Nif11-like leader peptide family natural product precursor [Eubacteriales bacterium]